MVAGPLLWNQAVTLCTAVAVQLRRARVITPAQLGAASASSVDGGLVAPKLSPNTPTDNLATLCEQRLDQALNLLARAVRAPDMEGGGAPFEDEESGGEAAEEWPPPVEDLRESCVCNLLASQRHDSRLQPAASASEPCPARVPA